MRDVRTDVREYFDAVVERVEAEQVLATVARDQAAGRATRKRSRLLARGRRVAIGVALFVLAGAAGVAALLLSPGGQHALNDVHDVAVGPDGTVWAVTSGGVVRWNPDTGNPTVFTESDGLLSTGAARIDITAAGVVWVAAEDWVAVWDGAWTSHAEFGGLDAGPITDMAVGHDGAAWFWADMIPDAGLLRFDGAGWAAVPAPADWLVVDDTWAPLAVSIDAAPDGTVWVGSDYGVLSFDGASWTHHGVADGLPSLMTPWVAAAPDGTIWVGTTSLTREVAPRAGVASFDGSVWSIYTTEDGLAADEGRVAVGPDGTVWALHDDAVSRFDGERWTSVEVEGDSFGAAVGSDGSLWRPTPSGIEQIDGSSVLTTLVAPADVVPAEIAPLHLTPIGEPTRTSTPIGDITWHRFAEPTGHGLHDIEVTPHGLIAVDGVVVRWSEDLVTWPGAHLSFDPWRLTPDGDEVVVHGAAAARLVWKDSVWFESAVFETPAGGEIAQIVIGDAGAVATAGSGIYHSTDGREFAPAEPAPDPTRLQADWIEAEIIVMCSPVGTSGSSTESIGPVLATHAGFVAMTPAYPGDWDKWPRCEPVLWFSADGRSWDLVSPETPFGDGAQVRGVASRDGRHVAVGAARGGRSAAWVSDDGLDWTAIDLPETLEQPTAVAGSSDGWVLIEARGAGWVSRNGVTWEPIPAGMPAADMFWAPQSLSMGHGMIAVSGTEELVFGVLDDGEE